MVRPLLWSLVLVLLASCQQTPPQQTPPTPAPAPAPAVPDPGGEPPVTLKGDMSTNYSDAAMAVATNAREEVFVAGVQATYFDRGLSTPYGNEQSGQVGPLRLFVNRYSSRAETLGWSRLIEVPCPTGPIVVTCSVRAVDLALAADDSSLLLSESRQEESDTPTWETQALLHKLSPDGAVLWTKGVSKTENSRPLGLGAAGDGTSYLLWQALSKTPFDENSRFAGESYLGVKLSKLGPDGNVLWTKAVETPLSYRSSVTDLSYFDVADVALSGETVVVAGFGRVQAFGTGGEPLWQTALEYTPVAGGEPADKERYYTRAEVVASGNLIYVGRNSEQREDMSPATAQRLELTALDGSGNISWTKTVGDEQNYVYNTSLSANTRDGLYVAGTSLPILENVNLEPNGFLSVFNPSGEKGEARTAPVSGTIYGVASPDGEGVYSYLVGVTGDPSFYYDTPELTVQDAFLSFGASARETKY